jgi:hypothetical protein
MTTCVVQDEFHRALPSVLTRRAHRRVDHAVRQGNLLSAAAGDETVAATTPSAGEQQVPRPVSRYVLLL